MTDIEKIARAMFNSSHAWSDTAGLRSWTWDHLDDTSTRYWIRLAQAAHDEMTKLNNDKVELAKRQMLEDRHTGDDV